MGDVKPRRVEYVEQTRESILVAAEELFRERGYQASSIEAVGAAARFTKGAVYRHFPDKQTLFRAVFERVETATVHELELRARDAAQPVDRARVVLEGFLEIALRDRFRRVVLEEGPIALGYREWRELDHSYTATLLERLLGDLIEAGTIEPTPVRPLARLCCALVGEATFELVEAAHDGSEEAEVRAALTAILRGLDPVPKPVSGNRFPHG